MDSAGWGGVGGEWGGERVDGEIPTKRNHTPAPSTSTTTKFSPLLRLPLLRLPPPTPTPHTPPQRTRGHAATRLQLYDVAHDDVRASDARGHAAADGDARRRDEVFEARERAGGDEFLRKDEDARHEDDDEEHDGEIQRDGCREGVWVCVRECGEAIGGGKWRRSDRKGGVERAAGRAKRD